MKHRARSSKIKYQHSMIHGLRRFLEEQLEPLESISTIIPGEIKRTKGTRSGFQIRFKYATETGAKLLAYSPGAVQEVFIVTTDIEALKSKLSSLRLHLDVSPVKHYRPGEGT